MSSKNLCPIDLDIAFVGGVSRMIWTPSRREDTKIMRDA
jgi:hypothetical protein